MREIKFRAWNKEKKIMCYDNEDNTKEYFDGINSTEIGFINYRLSIPKDDSDWYFRSRYDVMQYTGLKDKNGKEIFEGDIVNIEIPVVSVNEDFIGQVKMLEGRWWVDNGNDAIPLWSEINIPNIVGNIYENPELLEGQHD
ncbi:YopX family protein [Lysinibacillus sphaericus]|uniref:YopX family protein n=1 Tax=Lysinibacillus sphaericus TaxID=1421 RepID=UPI002DBE6BFC|nr:YopX family protein [Lysinibacillus sphaericus]MEB7455107.1 YopX family protein [Lysinibacillus sphaericus]